MGGCVLGMDSRLRGNDGCLGVAACWGWVPAFAGMAEVWGRERRMFGRGCVLGMGSRLRGNDGSLGAGTTDVWGWLRVGDGFPPVWERRMFGGGCVLGMGSRLRGNDGSLGAGTTDFTVTVIPVETGIQARGGVVDGVGGCGILPASRYSFPFSRQVSRTSFRACSRQPRRRAAPDLPDLRPRFPKLSPRRTSVRRHGASWDGFSGAA